MLLGKQRIDDRVSTYVHSKAILRSCVLIPLYTCIYRLARARGWRLQLNAQKELLSRSGFLVTTWINDEETRFTTIEETGPIQAMLLVTSWQSWEKLGTEA